PNKNCLFASANRQFLMKVTYSTTSIQEPVIFINGHDTCWSRNIINIVCAIPAAYSALVLPAFVICKYAFSFTGFARIITSHGLPSYLLPAFCPVNDAAFQHNVDL